MTGADSFPRLRPVGDGAVLIEFGARIDAAIHARVLALDAALQAEPFTGFMEAIPAYASILVAFDPLAAREHDVAAHIGALLKRPAAARPAPAVHDVPVCYDAAFAPDLAPVAAQTGISTDAVIAAHLAGDYHVFMYGFAPGYAYLGGVGEAIQLPRKSEPVRDVPAGSVIIAGPQCIVTTLTMPTGWWIVGRSPLRILRPADKNPFLFQVGDRLRFTRVDRDRFEALSQAAP